ncbi:MAG: 2-isopropylmalate synthase, partial [Clostridia bacterium]|nr:2-isopropylmalate synthase [Deltaproteobacteria bacterium]
VARADIVTFSTQCHDDLGCATAISLAGVLAGARQIVVCINGIGERAGNTPLEEVVMAMNTRADLFNFTNGVDTTQIMRASKLVISCCGFQVPPNKAVVGANAFAHESGIHQDGMLKNASTYEIMRPESIGQVTTQLVLGKHSGRHAVKMRLSTLGYALTDNDITKAFERFKLLADRKKVITDADLEALVKDELVQPKERYTLAGLEVSCGTSGASATARINGPDGERSVTAKGSGPVDATYEAIDTILGVEGHRLVEYAINAVTEGIDALAEATVKIESAELGAENPQTQRTGRRLFLGHGADTDIVVASAKAYISALNKILAVTAAHAEENVSSEQRTSNQATA